MRAIFLLLWVLAGPYAAIAQQMNSAVKNGSVSTELSPAFFALGGFGGKVFYNAPEKWSVGLQVEGGFDLPDFARADFFEGADNIRVRWDYAYGIQFRYRFNSATKNIRGFHLQGGMGYEQWTIQPVANADERDQLANLYAGFAVGYNLMPSKKIPLYLNVAYGVIFILNNTDTRAIGAATYNIRTVVPPSLAPTLAIGWHFQKETE